MNLSNVDLVKNTCLINGQWLDSAKKFEVKNPANGEILALIPDFGELETKKAIEAAHKTFQIWKSKSATFRANLLKKWFQLMVENEVDLGKILSAEQGKPVNEAIGEIRYGNSYIEWFGEEARRTYGDIIPGHDEDKRIMVIKQPVGVVGIITPWNFPNAMIARKVAPALAAGCTVVIKPSELTPLSALAMAYLAEQAGIPAGVINIITSTNAPIIGKELTSNKLVRKISFTGSTAVGKILIKECADHVKKVSMELGGNAPFIVFDDANIDEAVAGAMISKYRNAGQTCVCANRIYVQEKVYDEFIEKFSKAVLALKVGNGDEKGVEIGPLIDERAVLKVKKILQDAENKGAKIEVGGKSHILGGTFFEPTIVSNCTAEMDFAKEEIFGPVAPIFKFATEQEVIFMANNTEFGLASYFYGQNINRIYSVAEALEYGMVGVNTGLISTAVAPFGGIKESGYGREGSKYGISDYMEMKYICIGGVK